MSFYSKLTYNTGKGIGINSWIGNLRWYARECEDGHSFKFQTMSCLKNSTHEECVENKMCKNLFDLTLTNAETNNWSYGADYITVDDVSIYFPFYEYGCIIKHSQELNIAFEGTATLNNNTVTVTTDAYTVCFIADSKVSLEGSNIIISGVDNGKVAVSFYIDDVKADSCCKRLFDESESILNENRVFWNEYLASCPTVELAEDFVYKRPELGIDDRFTPEDVVIRQLWHYWCMLINVNEVEFNKLPLYIAPDKIGWLGTWSNDGLQCMAALSLTNQKELAKRLIISYLETSLTTEGVFTWYTHADGVPSNGTIGDVGRFSHGAPYFPQTVYYYIRHTGDRSILTEQCGGGMTVYEKLKKYITNLHSLRDVNGDELIEWANLWETGWDDKGGTFFSKASIDKWMEVVSTYTDEEIAEFYRENQCPVTTIVEQVLTLWSFKAMKKMATEENDFELAEYCENRINAMISAVSNTLWNEQDGFYYDIDVNTNTQTREKSADAFYWFNFENDKKRQERLLEHLTNPKEFYCYYMPMLSYDSEQFNEHGYWSGGHWSREMSIISMGLKRCGYDDWAKELIVRALMVAEGPIICEVTNPLTGKMSTGITKMACAIMNVMAINDIFGGKDWDCDK